jgi:hypothetical protein
VKKVLLLLFVVFLVFVIYNKQRLYLRDPFGGVMRDGVKEDGAQVFINYSNDVLLENDNAPMYVTVIQHENHVGTPAKLMCMHFVVCLADADVVTLVSTAPNAVVDSMTGKAVRYHEGKRVTVVGLR